MRRLVCASGLLLVCAALHAGEAPTSWFPDDPSCRLQQVPDDAGAVVTPGGFLLVHPRNDRLRADYSGCKTLWIDDEPGSPRRWSTLLFENGRLRRSVLWQRDAPEMADRVCDMPGSGARPLPRPQEPCSGIDGNELVALYLASYPRVCMTDPDRKECKQDPR
jgi:hypothetical protein